MIKMTSKSYKAFKRHSGGKEGMWVKYNPNPTGRDVEDCAIRAVAKALEIDWEKAYAMICSAGFSMGDMPHSNSVWGAVLRQHGFYRAAVPNSCPDCYTAEQFAADHPNGVFVLVFGNHTCCVKSGCIFDSWDSSGMSPQFFWFKQED